MIKSKYKAKNIIKNQWKENVMQTLFFLCGLSAFVSVLLISAYMIVAGAPAIMKVGIMKFLFGRIWDPASNIFGIFPFILSSVIATLCTILIAAPVGISVAIFLAKIVRGRFAEILRSAIELLAGIPSVVYGLLGAMLIVPLTFQLQTALHLQNGGSLLSSILVLTIMTLPTIISVSETSLQAVDRKYEEASLAIGASKMQSILKITLPIAKSGIAAGLVLGIGRAVGETMAVIMVAGNAPIMPQFFQPVRMLTVGISMEWAYSSGLHRQALFGISLVLFLFIMGINFLLHGLIKKGSGAHEK